MERNYENYSNEFNESSLGTLTFARNDRNSHSWVGVSDKKDLEKDSYGRYIVPPGLEEARVPIWNLRDGRKIAGRSCPLFKNLNQYLAKHAHCQVYTGQTTATHTPLTREAKRVRMWDRIKKLRATGGVPLESNLEAFLKKHPHLEPYVGQDKVTGEFGITRTVTAERGPTLLNLKSGKLIGATQRLLKRSLSEYLAQNPHLVVYDSQNKHHQAFLRDARRARKSRRLNDQLGETGPNDPAGYENIRQVVAFREEGLGGAIETTDTVGSADGNATAAVVAVSENEYPPNVRKCLEELDMLLGLNEHKEVLRSIAPEDLITNLEMDGGRIDNILFGNH